MGRRSGKDELVVRGPILDAVIQDLVGFGRKGFKRERGLFVLFRSILVFVCTFLFVVNGQNGTSTIKFIQLIYCTCFTVTKHISLGCLSRFTWNMPHNLKKI